MCLVIINYIIINDIIDSIITVVKFFNNSQGLWPINRQCLSHIKIMHLCKPQYKSTGIDEL